ncbi:hypothetical protein BKA70DRAFT_1374771 [Coprinopsis sp. MPI-PUGE-AT-0042]|nr:hypothetical protein BKA70DRAFT_1374771 [Coprinopsis sp. MPI-PUGE-AT-0042]
MKMRMPTLRWAWVHGSAPSCRTDPLVHHGRHFGRTIQAFAVSQTLIKNGLSRSVEMTFGRLEEDQLTPAERREHAITKNSSSFLLVLRSACAMASDEDMFHIAELIQKGSAGARADDTKGLKGVILDWITPRGQCLQPPLMRNVKTDRGFYHPQTGELLCPINLDWNNPHGSSQITLRFLSEQGRAYELVPSLWRVMTGLCSCYKDYKYYLQDVWKGLFRSALLVSAFKHIFTSPSSVHREPRATRSGNARIHGDEKCYHTVRFALSSSPTFSRTDLVTDSEALLCLCY